MATINPWEGNPYDTGRPMGQGAPSIEELFQQGNVGVNRDETPPQQAAGMEALAGRRMSQTVPWEETQAPEVPSGLGADAYRDLTESYLNQILASPSVEPEYAERLGKQVSGIQAERQAGKARETEQQKIQMQGVEQRKGIQLQEELQMQGQRERQAQEQAGAIERIRKTPLSGLLGMTLEQFEALPPEQQESYRKAIMMQSGGLGQVMQSIMTMIPQLGKDPQQQENLMHTMLAQARAIFTRQNVEDLLIRTVDASGNLRVRLKMLDPSGAAMAIKPGGQPYGPQEPWQNRMTRSMGQGMQVEPEAAMGGTGAGVEGLVDDRFTMEDMFRRQTPLSQPKPKPEVGSNALSAIRG